MFKNTESLRRHALFVFIPLLLLAVVVVCLSHRNSVSLHIISRDWHTLSFETSLSAQENSMAKMPVPVNFTGAGLMGGQAQAFFYSIGGVYTTDVGQQKWLEPIRFSSVYTNVVRVIDISDITWSLAFDAEAQQYSFVFKSANGSIQKVVYEPPFDHLPSDLAEREVYYGLVGKDIEFAPVSPEDSRGLPHLVIVGEKDVPYGWNMRRGCSVRLSTEYEPISQNRSILSVEELCPTVRDFENPYMQSLDEESRMTIHAGNSNVVIILEHFVMNSEKFGVLTDIPGEYLLFLDGSDNIRLELAPMEAAFGFSVLRSSWPSTGSDNVMFQLEPTSRRVRLDRSIGKLAVGTENYETDELSEIDILFSDWPRFANETRIISNESGQNTPVQFLSGKGLVSSAKLNGTELVKTPWSSLPEEIQGAIIGAIAGALVGGLSHAWLTWFRGARQKGQESGISHREQVSGDEQIGSFSEISTAVETSEINR